MGWNLSVSEQVYIAIEGLDTLAFLPDFTQKVEKALIQALNKTADRGRTSADKRIREQVNFPASYLRPSQGRLTVSKRASPGKFEARITGRDQTTSLARFSKQKPLPPGRRHPKGEIRVSVKKGGKYRAIPRAFLITLKNGNIGLAARTDGSKPAGAFKPKQLTKGDSSLWLLYGPSVDQVLSSARTGAGVVEEMTPEVLAFLEAEFNRNLKRMGI